MSITLTMHGGGPQANDSDPETLWVIGQTTRTTDRWERRSRCEDLSMGLVCLKVGLAGSMKAICQVGDLDARDYRYGRQDRPG